MHKNRGEWIARALLAAGLMAVAALVAAQSLGELAEKEKSRRAKETGEKSPTYTDEDLKRIGGDKKDKDDESTAAPAEPNTSDDASDLEDENLRQEERSWRGRAAAVREAVTAAESRLKELEDEASKTGSTILGSTDTMEILRLRARQNEIEKETEHARAELERAREELQRFEDEARGKNVPAGWLRARN
jgi:hypothetical protein